MKPIKPTQLTWACCTSTIGGPCGHRSPPTTFELPQPTEEENDAAAAAVFDPDAEPGPWEITCPLCQGATVTVLAEESSSGFSGAPIFWYELSCGHQAVDASADTIEWVM
jgi:hypothetical protein